ncbi:hypothetical protein ACJJTC_008855 [Scirpophaga incertulas]
MVKTRSQSKNMIGGTSAGSASSKTSVVAQRLALEAQHARRVAEIEMGQIQAEREERARAAAAERAAVDAELRADIAALESRSSRGSRASHAPSQTSAHLRFLIASEHSLSHHGGDGFLLDVIDFRGKVILSAVIPSIEYLSQSSKLSSKGLGSDLQKTQRTK